MIAVFSRGIRDIPHIESLLGDRIVYRPLKARPEVDRVVGWGMKPNTKRARRYAQAHGLPYISLEDGFLRSRDLGVKGASPLSIVVDDVGIYYDATRPSRLEHLLNTADAEIAAARTDAVSAIQQIRTHRLSKYNHAPDMAALPAGKPRVLVVDQTVDDLSVSLGAATAASFREMLSAARAENPGATLYLKVHPDVICGKKSGYLAHVCDEEDLIVISEDVNPISLVEQMDKVYVVTSQLGFEALMLGKPVHCFGLPFYAGWGATIDRVACARRVRRRDPLDIFAAAYLLYARYLNPNTGRRGTIFDVIDHLALQRRIGALNQGNLFCFGFQRWKRRYVRPFLWGAQRVVFARSVRQALRMGMTAKDPVLVWGHNETADVRTWTTLNGVLPWRIEDGFLRSVGLGSDLIKPISLVVDRTGIYYDPRSPSDLETLLNSYDCDDALRARAEEIRRQIVDHRLTKYNTDADAPLMRRVPSGRRAILVPGQVEDDASIRQGCTDVRTNADLLHAVRASHPDAYIVYKPHPDTMVRNRRARTSMATIRGLCDHIETRAGVIDCLDAVDEVHTMTSLTGFDALLRGKTVVTYGGPFYAGWGLTRDRQVFPRRTRVLDLQQLVAVALIVYPRYINEVGDGFVSTESGLDSILARKNHIKCLGAAKAARTLRPDFCTRQARKTALLLQGWCQEWFSTSY